MARVICCVFFTLAIRRRMSGSVAIGKLAFLRRFALGGAACRLQRTLAPGWLLRLRGGVLVGALNQRARPLELVGRAAQQPLGIPRQGLLLCDRLLDARGGAAHEAQ